MKNYRYFIRRYNNDTAEIYRLPAKLKKMDMKTIYEYYSRRELQWCKGDGRDFFRDTNNYEELTYGELMLECI